MRLRKNAERAIIALTVILLAMMYIMAEMMDSAIWVLPILILAGIETILLVVLDRYGR